MWLSLNIVRQPEGFCSISLTSKSVDHRLRRGKQSPCIGNRLVLGRCALCRFGSLGGGALTFLRPAVPTHAEGYWRNRRRCKSLGFILAFLFSLVLAHRDAFIVLCKFKQPFLRRVEAHPVR